MIVWRKIGVKLLHHIVFILLQACLHYWSHSGYHVDGPLGRRFIIRCRDPLQHFRTLRWLVQSNIDDPVYFQRMHIVLPSSYKFVFTFDKLNLRVWTLLIIVENLCHRSLLVVWASAYLETTVIWRVYNGGCLTKSLVQVAIALIAHDLRSLWACSCRREQDRVLRESLWNSLVHYYFI